jgi:hypothetical protein
MLESFFFRYPVPPGGNRQAWYNIVPRVCPSTEKRKMESSKTHFSFFLFFSDVPIVEDSSRAPQESDSGADERGSAAAAYHARHWKESSSTAAAVAPGSTAAIYVCVCVYVCMYTCACMYVCTHTYVYIHILS